MASPTTGPVPGDEVEHAGRQADVVDDLGEDEGVERGDLRRLEHHGAAGGQRGRDLGGDLVERVVPRRDGADDADRLLHDERVADRLLELERLDDPAVFWNDISGRPACTSRLRLFTMPTSWVTSVAISSMPGLTALGDAGEVLGPLLDRGLRPRREGGLGGGDGLVDVLRGCRRGSSP